jgi:L-cysteine S-thiosulfotransferase
MKTLSMTHNVLWLVLIICLLILIFPVGCTPVKESGLGFRLPEGSVEQGKLAFVELNCIRCHSIKGEEDAVTRNLNRDVHVVLGGETTRVKTYGQLVTSVVFPDHIILPKYRADYTDRDGHSEMEDMTDKMTVKQLIDLVTYLETTYKVVPPANAYDMTYP